MTYENCPLCGGDVMLEDGYWVCVTPGTCTWSVEDDTPCYRNGGRDCDNCDATCAPCEDYR